MILTRPAVLLRVEGGALTLAAVAAYSWTSGSWGVFALFFLAPDLSLLAYLAGPRVGAAAYNLVHTYLWPVLLGVAGVAAGHALLTHLALIWAAHISADRLVGYGLKSPASFKETHLQRLG